MGSIEIARLRKWTYPELQKVSEDELNNFFNKEGSFAITYRFNKIIQKENDQFYRTVGFSLAWGLIIFGVIVVSFYFAVAVVAIKLIRMFMGA